MFVTLHVHRCCACVLAVCWLTVTRVVASAAGTRTQSWLVTVALTAAGKQLYSYIRSNGDTDIPKAAEAETHLGDDELKCLLRLQLLIAHRAKSTFTAISSTRKEFCIIKESHIFISELQKNVKWIYNPLQASVKAKFWMDFQCERPQILVPAVFLKPPQEMFRF